MKTILALSIATLITAGAVFGDPALTIYNQNFAVVRDTIHLDLKQGENTINYSGATMRLEPDSVILRDPSGLWNFRILEQNFRADPISQGLLLNYYEGQTIDFEKDADAAEPNKKAIIRGKIIRSGYVPPNSDADGEQSPPAQLTGQPIIEVAGKLMFRLPGEPLFPALPDDSILKPTLTWEIDSGKAGLLDAELGYITGGMSWHADYNLVAPENGDVMDLVGWVTINNQSGKTFQHARIKLMAGDVNKIEPRRFRRVFAPPQAVTLGMGPPVSEKTFDEYHLYTLDRPTTLLDRETKQVEFVQAQGIHAQTLYIYDGARLENFNGWDPHSILENRDYGVESDSKISVVREFFNSATNHLGMPLPKGRIRFYRTDADGQMEFTGENEIDHTPRDERIRITTGNAFDLVGKRTRTNFAESEANHWIDESFEIQLRNHKKEAVEIRVVEHLNRSAGWKILTKSDDFRKIDAQTVEFRVPVEPNGEKKVSYSVRYTW